MFQQFKRRIRYKHILIIFTCVLVLFGIFELVKILFYYENNHNKSNEKQKFVEEAVVNRNLEDEEDLEMSKEYSNENIIFETEYLRYVISNKGEVLEFTDKITGKDYVNRNKSSLHLFAWLKKDASLPPIRPVSVTSDSEYVYLNFENVNMEIPKTEIKLKYKVEDEYITFEVVSANRQDFYSLTYGAADLEIDYSEKESFGAATLSMKLNTDTRELPGKNNLMGAICYPELGIIGSKAAIIGSPEDEVREIMKKVLANVKKGDLPVSTVGGPFAQEYEGNYGTYIITSELIDPNNLDSWIEMLKKFNIDQVDFHQGLIFRQGDMVFNEKMYPNGISDFKKIIDRLHQEGIKAGLHTYAYYIHPDSSYISPVPSKDLDILAQFTLSWDIDSEENIIPVDESTANISLTTGFFVKNSHYLMIDDEIIQFRNVSRTSPYGFTEVIRGACGTKPAPHKKGAEVKHLTQFFFMFTPRPDSELFLEIARKTAQVYNEAGFDMIYLDALDGIGTIVKKPEFAWYYATLFVNEILKYTEKPPILEYSTMYPNLWYARSRMGALDIPTRGYKTFVDLHCNLNDQQAHSKYLPSQLGWLSLYPPSIIPDELPNFQVRYLFSEDLDYIGTKSIAYNSGLSYVWNIDQTIIETFPILSRYSERIKQYELLRKSNYFSDEVKEKLKAKGLDYSLIKDSKGEWAFIRKNYDKTKILSMKDGRNSFITNNPFDQQKPALRIEALYSAESYESDKAIDLIVFNEEKDIKAQPMEVSFSNKPLNLKENLALGVWIYGNGSGDTINIQLSSPEYRVSGFADHFIKVDFTGWRYFTLVETDNGEYPEIKWKGKEYDESNFFKNAYKEFREMVYYDEITSVKVMQSGDSRGIRLKTIKALPVKKLEIKDPSLVVNGKKITFKTKLQSGTYLEYYPNGECVVYDLYGNVVDKPQIEGELAELPKGESRVTFECENAGTEDIRAIVTVITEGEIVK